MAYLSAHHPAAVEGGQILADPQPQPRAATALQCVAVELHELSEQSRLVLHRNTYHKMRHSAKAAHEKHVPTYSGVHDFNAKKVLRDNKRRSREACDRVWCHARQVQYGL